jgi:UDP-N-acetylglucosamine 2-epimerase (non-hydrolysing)
LTLRDNTERPITCTAGTNRLVAGHRQAIENSAEAVLNGPPAGVQIPEKWMVAPPSDWWEFWLAASSVKA